MLEKISERGEEETWRSVMKVRPRHWPGNSNKCRTKAAIAEQRKFRALLKMLRAGLS